MKTGSSIVMAIVVVGVSFTSSANLYYNENFDGMGTSGTTPPAGWAEAYIEGDASNLTAPTSAEMATALYGISSLTIWNQTDPATSFFVQAANMGSTVSDANRLLGTSPTSVRGEILELVVPNNSGSAITSVRVSYDMKAMANGTLKSGFTDLHEELAGYRFYFLDGSTWTPFSALDLANDALNSVGHAEAEITYTSAVADGGTMQFRWFDDNSEAYSPDFTFAIDNVSVVVPEPATLSLLLIGALALGLRRRIG